LEKLEQEAIMTQKRYQVGDRVELKSGGPIMTVTDLMDSFPDDCNCSWFNGENKLEQGAFKMAALKEAEED
jgi:uncharacterized protein YodC (DUF2158 family)